MTSGAPPDEHLGPALDRADLVSSELLVAGRRLRLEAASHRVAAALDPALGHLLATDVELSTSIDGAAPTFGRDRSAPGSDGFDELAGAARLRVWVDDERRPEQWDPRPSGPRRLPGGGILVSRPEPPALESFTSPGELGLWASEAALASGDLRAHPASTAIAAWLAGTGAQVLHVGAVADSHGAALLLGPSGAGKSTTALAAAAGGLGLLGDDLCVVTQDGPPTVHALYATAKVTATTERHLGLGDQTVLGRTPKDKLVVAIGGALRVVSCAPVVALVVLAPPTESVVGPTPLPGRTVARALAPTALKAALGAGDLAQWLHLCAALARNVPGFSLRLGWDLDAVTRMVSEAIERGSETMERRPGVHR